MSTDDFEDLVTAPGRNLSRRSVTTPSALGILDPVDGTTSSSG